MKIEDELNTQPQEPLSDANTVSPVVPDADANTPTTYPPESSVDIAEVAPVASEAAVDAADAPEPTIAAETPTDSIGEAESAEQVSLAVASDTKKKGSRPIIRDVLETALIVLVVFFLVRTFIQNYQVDGDSMLPTLHNDEYLLVNKAPFFVYDSNFFGHIFNSSLPSDVHYPLGGPTRGDIVVFNAPIEPRDFVKRVIAVAGETVEIKADPDPIGSPGSPCGDCGVYVNGTRLNEPYTRATPDYSIDKLTVPDGYVYVLGDNRRNSEDSHIFGPIRLSSIVGTVLATYWPANMWGFFSHPNYPELQK